MQQAATNKPDFWSIAGQSELQILDALAHRRLASAEPGITASLRDLKSRVAAPRQWDSIYEEAEFTLLPYIAFVTGAEKRAAQTLLDELKAMAKE